MFFFQAALEINKYQTNYSVRKSELMFWVTYVIQNGSKGHKTAALK